MVPPVNLIPVDAVAHIIFPLSSAQRGLHFKRELFRGMGIFPFFVLWYIFLIPAFICNKNAGMNIMTELPVVISFGWSGFF